MKKLYRTQDNKIIAGVCSGFADYFNVDITIVRLIWIFFTIFGGVGILAYIFSVILIPEGDSKNNNEITTKDDSDDKLVIWGVVIIIVGILMLFRHRPILSTLWHSFSGNWFNILFAVAVIAVGVYILINRKKDGDGSSIGLELSGLHISETDKKLAGVCGGIAETIKIDSTIVRLIWVIGTLLSAGIGVILYIICMLVFSKNNDELAKTE